MKDIKQTIKMKRLVHMFNEILHFETSEKI